MIDGEMGENGGKMGKVKDGKGEGLSVGLEVGKRRKGEAYRVGKRGRIKGGNKREGLRLVKG